MKKFIIILILFTFSTAQKYDETLKRIASQYENIEDFSGKVQITADIPNLRMPVKTIKIFYKYPDKMKMKVKGFALLPKDGILPFRYFNQMISDSSGAVKNYTLMSEEKTMTTLAIADTTFSKNGRLLLILDNYLERIEKILLMNDGDTLTTLDFTYQNIDGYWIPETTRFHFNLAKRIPRASGPSITNPFGSIELGSPDDHYQSDGKITLYFSEIQINTGLDESVFTKEK